MSANAHSRAVLPLPEPECDNAIEQRFVAYAGSFGGFCELLAVANLGIRVGLEKVRPPFTIEAEIHARVAAQLQQAIQARLLVKTTKRGFQRLRTLGS